jgi:hypothetical protein
MKDLFSKVVKLSNVIFGDGIPTPKKADVPNSDKKEWDFGSKQAKVTIENEQFSWSLFGNGGSSYPLSSVRGLQYEKGAALSLLSHFVVLASGGDNKRVMVPKTPKTEELIKSINSFLSAYHEKPQAAPTVASAAPPSSVADELAKLASLKQQGVLTEQEFEEQKRRILTA